MNKKQIINTILVIAVLVIAYVIFKTYVYRDLFFGRNRGEKGEQGIENGNNEAIPPVPNEFGCSDTYNTSIVIDYNDPEANMGGCGIEVLNFQTQLNTEFGQNLALDGKYGANTRQAHQNVLDSMNGTWDGGYTVYVSDVDPDAVFYG